MPRLTYIVAAILLAGFALFGAPQASAQPAQGTELTIVEQADGAVLITLADGTQISLTPAMAQQLATAAATGNAQLVQQSLQTVLTAVASGTSGATIIGGSTATTPSAISGNITANIAAAVAAYTVNKAPQLAAVIQAATVRSVPQAAAIVASATVASLAQTVQAAAGQGGPPANLPALPQQALNSPVINTTENPAQASPSN